jgi:hypothetical protein
MTRIVNGAALRTATVTINTMDASKHAPDEPGQSRARDVNSDLR